MKHGRQANRLKDRVGVGFLLMVFVFCQDLGICRCLNEEGLALLRVRDKVVSDPFGSLRNWKEDDGEIDPCSWFGVECSDGKVVALNLRDLCLGGTLAPEIGNLVHIRAIILRNNIFSGVIPEEIGELKELEVLDLGYNNFSGPLPYKLGNNFSLAILLVDNNELLTASSPEIQELTLASESQVDENHLSIAANKLACKMRCNAWKVEQTSNVIHRRVLAAQDHPARAPAPRAPAPASAPAPAPAPAHSTPSTPAPAPSTPSTPAPAPSTPSAPAPASASNSPASLAPNVRNTPAIIGGAVGGSFLILITILGVYLYRSNKVATVKPWATGLSGQLQKAFVTGLPKLKRAEVEAACEDFSNVVGSSSIGTIYKGTLSSGVEIAVASVAVKSSKDWSKNLEVQFRNMVGTLSKVNHKNFINLLGYCEEEEPFTRMMVFEYAPNGTLFEHLHIKESEHLDWGMRLRIAMGMAYCLEHMHLMNPPMVHKNLNSSAVTLTEDYAAKICDFNFWNHMAAAKIEQSGIDLLNTVSTSRGPRSNVYSFGVILFEMVTGRLPYSVDNGSVEDWASDYLRGEQPLRGMVDPSLDSCQEEQVDRIGQVIKSCVHPDPRVRPAMREVVAMLWEITRITRDVAIPKISPVWWAELEVLSTDAN
ncbi:inactive receptor-like serine/threonine-protein kinase At2g40270 [Syzygium oleosum]|uniref:inactive receptor-like serine/threonine-protein kinase At2g40270 n=1 Tax=Syzygium oleosum TaxID=219896 RepID=UPI0011D23A80|nr:inactive receptor-like serine/threonine-protein kinase At2g40270 [Syzygium oleosum]